MTRNSCFARAFTLIEMAVVLAVIAIMMAFLYPAYVGMSQRAKATKDMSNLRQIGIAMQTYLNDNDQILPLSSPSSPPWPGTLATPVLYPNYVAKERKIFQSPFDKRPSSEATDGTPPVSYGVNINIYNASPGVNRNMLKVVSPASTFFMAPNYTGNPGSTSSWTGTAGNAPVLPQGAPAETTGTHNNGRQINVLFCDWHSESVTFGPSGTAGTFQNTATHWDPTQ